MKLIIDIPETMIQELKDGCFGVKHNVYELAGCIMNGTPIEDIKTEITNIPITDTDGHNNNWYREPQAIIDDVIKIIDRYRK